jgi:hypothetical protein
LDKERERIFSYHRSGVYTNEEFLEQKNAIEVQKNEKARLLGQGADSGELLTQALGELVQWFRSPAESWIELEPTYSRRLQFQRMIFKEALPFDGKTFGTAELTSVYGMISEFQGDRSGLVAQVRMKWNQIIDQIHAWAGFSTQE